MKEFVVFVIPVLTAILGLISGIILEKYRAKQSIRTEKQKMSLSVRMKVVEQVSKELHNINKSFEFTLASLQINRGQWSEQIYVEWHEAIKQLEKEFATCLLYCDFAKDSINTFIPFVKRKILEFEDNVKKQIDELPPEAYATQIDSITNVVPKLKDKFQSCISAVDSRTTRLLEELKYTYETEIK
jgi:hypothetical protein